MRRPHGPLLLAAIFVVSPVAAHASPAPTGDVKGQCIDAHERAQSLRRDGRLRAARESLLICTRPTCPSVIQKECGPWLEEVEAERPSIVVSVRDIRGDDVTIARLWVDGSVVAERLDGRQIELDPGEHTVRVQLPSGSALEQHLVLREGEKRRAVNVDFAAGPHRDAPVVTVPRSAAESTRTITGSTVGILGLGALAGGIALAVLQDNAASSAHAACAAGCVAGSPSASAAESEANSARTERVWEGVSFGAAGAALAVSIYLLATRHVPEPDARLGASTAPGFVIDASPRGASARWILRF